jgi:hypothetical protein
MQLQQIQAIKARITSKIERGDYITASKVVGISSQAVQMRYQRNKEKEVLLMRSIVTEREKLIKKLKAKYEESPKKRSKEHLE